MSAPRSTILRRRLAAALVLAGAVAAALVLVRPGDAPPSHGASPPAPPPATVPRSTPRATAALPARLPAVLPRRALTVPILMYHRIDRLSPALSPVQRGLTVPPDEFAAEMRWLHANGYRALTQRQLWNALMLGRKLPAKPVMITFDDGYRDVFGKAMPVLRALHLHATAYIITDRIDGPDPSFLTWGRIRSLERNGIEIGSHTVNHLDLTTLDAADARHQLVASKRQLEQRLGHPVRFLAYPAGKHDAAVVALARQAGYLLAVTTVPGARQHAASPLELHRYEVLDSTHVAGLAALLGQ